MAGSYIRPLVSILLISAAASAVHGAPAPKVRLQLFNVAILKQPSDKLVTLLLPKRDGDIEPETVMVDIGDGRFYAATVRYPKKVTLEHARSALNIVYKKWERKSFAKDPAMGIWRIEDDKITVQLSEDDDNTVIIYIKYDSLPKRAEGLVEDALRKIIEDATPEELELLPESLRDAE